MSKFSIGDKVKGKGSYKAYGRGKVRMVLGNTQYSVEFDGQGFELTIPENGLEKA